MPEDSVGLLREAAAQAQERRDWAAARSLWQQVTEREPTFVGGWVQLGNMCNELADYPSALEAFAEAAMRDPLSYDAVAGKAGVCERAGQWPEALLAWQDAIRLLRPDKDADRTVHAYTHAVLAAYHIGDVQSVARVSMLAAAAAPGFLTRRESLPLRAKLLRSDEPQQAKHLLLDYMQDNPNDSASRFEFASVCLEDGDYRRGLDIIAPCLDARSADGSFFWLAADLHERLNEWAECMALCERMLARDVPELRFVRRTFEIAVRLSDLMTARRLARMFAKMTGDDLTLIDGLRRAYEDAGEFQRARLICRWLVRRWPHSRGHMGRLIMLTAQSLGLVAADRLVRACNAAQGRDQITDQAYCQAAFAADQHAEAQRRLTWYLAQSNHAEADPDSDVLLGYVLANSAGLDAAEQHFLNLAARSFQSRGALVGLAHMASRRRDLRATLDLWAKISAMYPEDTIARVEYARAAYNIGDTERARSICEKRLRELPSDVTIGEFYVWLMVAMGDYPAAESYLPTLRMHGGASWAGLEAAVQSAGQLGMLDQAWPEIEAFIPRASTDAAAGRTYHVVRLLQYFNRPDLATNLLHRVNIEPRRMAWLAPYSGGIKVAPSLLGPAKTAWQRIAAEVKDDTSSRLLGMTPEEVRRALGRPRDEHPIVHVINKFEQARGGSELHALDVAAHLGKHARVELWAPEMPHPEFSSQHGVQAVDRSQGRVPYGGVLVFIGVYFSINWIAHTRPERIIFLYNTFEAPMLYARIAEAFALTGIRPELLLCSNLMGEECGLPGFFEPSPIDIDLFKPSATPRNGPFTLGRHSRDVVEKHHPEDGLIYQAVGELGGKSVVLGGVCMRSVFGTSLGLDLMPARTAGIVNFLHDLDVYLYRTSTWVEPWGRVVIEAMACALPVLVHDVGGYAQVIEHEKNGLLFHTTSEAVALVRRLAQDAPLRLRLGKAARETVEELLGPEKMARLALFYLMRS